MTTRSLVFAAQPELPPVLAVLPCLEVLVAVKLGDDKKALVDLWRRMTEPIDPLLRFAHDNVRWRGEVGRADASRDRAIATAFAVMTGGPSRAATPVDWAFCIFGDAASPDGLATTSATCSIGWADDSGARGLSLRVTCPPTDETFRGLERLATEIATAAQPLWRWMTLGYRFAPVSFHCASFADALELIYRRSRRFQGVDVGDPFGFYLAKATKQLRTVGFVTVLSPALLALGAPPALPPPDGPLRCTTIGGALFVRAGDAPSVLDVNWKESRASYRAADSLCGPWRAKGGLNFFAPWDEESTARWLDRFRAEDPAARSDVSDGDSPTA